MSDIWPSVKQNDEHYVVSGRFEGLFDVDKEYWFELPKGVSPDDASIGHALLLAGLFAAMQQGGTYRLRGKIDRSALMNLAELNAIWSVWRPEKYSIIEFQADTVVASEPPNVRNPGAVLAFSGGVDSSASLWRHTKGDMGWRKRPVAVTVAIHGFDVPASDFASFDTLATRMRHITESVEVPLQTVRTNIREMPDNWEDVFAAKLAAVLHLFGGKYSNGIFGSCQPYANPIIPWGSTPITNGFLGSDNFPIFTDGAELSRLQKVEIIHTWQECLENIRVCWQPHSGGVNCGVCEKCVRTKLELACFGVANVPAFQSTLSVDQIRGIALRNTPQLALLEEIVAYTQQRNLHPDWLPALKRGIEKGFKNNRNGPIRKGFSHLKALAKKIAKFLFRTGES